MQKKPIVVKVDRLKRHDLLSNWVLIFHKGAEFQRSARKVKEKMERKNRCVRFRDKKVMAAIGGAVALVVIVVVVIVIFAT